MWELTGVLWWVELGCLGKRLGREQGAIALSVREQLESLELC